MQLAAALRVSTGVVALAVAAHSQQPVSWLDPSPHTVRSVTVEETFSWMSVPITLRLDRTPAPLRWSHATQVSAIVHWADLRNDQIV
jgi:hypothetical protein